MITTLTLENFKGFPYLEFPRLSGVNLIGGVNNSGKTAALEAIYLLLQRDRNALAQMPRLFRAANDVNDDLNYWRRLANDRDPKQNAIIAATMQNGRHQVTWSVDTPSQGYDALYVVLNRYLAGQSLSAPQRENWPKPEVFMPGAGPAVDDARMYIRAVKYGNNESRIEGLLAEIDPRLLRIRAYPDENTGKSLLFADFGDKEALPATHLGQGFNRLLRIYSALLGKDAKIFLIDEVETGLHHSALPTIWRGLAAVARQEGVQIFATTHSREAIFAAHRTFMDEPEYDFAYYRLERDARGEIKVVTYDKDALEGADERNFEVR